MWLLPNKIRPYPGRTFTFQPLYVFRHKVLALARQGMWQGAIAGCVGLTRATVNRILRRHAATGTLVPGKSMGAHRKTTPRQDHALLRMVQQSRFISVRGSTARMRNFYGMRAGRKTINNRLLSRGYCIYRPTGKPTTTVSAWSEYRVVRTWQAHRQDVIFGDESRFQLYPVDGRIKVRRLPGESF